MAYEVEYSADRANALRNLQVADHAGANWVTRSDVNARSEFDLDETDGKWTMSPMQNSLVVLRNAYPPNLCKLSPAQC